MRVKAKTKNRKHVGDPIKVGRVLTGTVEKVLPSGAVLFVCENGYWNFAAFNDDHWEERTDMLFGPDPVDVPALREIGLGGFSG